MSPKDNAHAPGPSEHDLFLRLHTIDEMVRVNEETERRLQRIAERRRIPPVPDLRFEYSYVRSVAPYVHIEQVSSEQASIPTSEKGKEKAVEGVDVGEPATASTRQVTDVVHVDWGRIVWITTRDQVISPLLQGALWCVFSALIVTSELNGRKRKQGCCEPLPAAARRGPGPALPRVVGTGRDEEQGRARD
ncbi:hypothetical protein TRAPUB_6445 [Trametes pubescens]|uniref:Uncharacterized protein n=1 Tax=Trametes pubescens TaxID=154538 RepID=A0A1M2V659_TRAPU|nr:hypothetical protein TRAPUB_6445 [Trametes pubescens]